MIGSARDNGGGGKAAQKPQHQQQAQKDPAQKVEEKVEEKAKQPEQEQKATKPAPKPKPKPEPKPKPKPAPEPEYASVGEKVTVDDEAYQVDAASKQNGIHSALENLKGTFVVANFTFYNTGSDTRTLDESAITLKDSQGRTYDVIQDNMMVVPSSKDIFLEDVSPGVYKQGRVYFNVAPTASGFVMVCEHTNWLSSAKPAKVELGF
jgi:hypothetical protein